MAYKIYALVDDHALNGAAIVTQRDARTFVSATGAAKYARTLARRHRAKWNEDNQMLSVRRPLAMGEHAAVWVTLT